MRPGEAPRRGRSRGESARRGRHRRETRRHRRARVSYPTGIPRRATTSSRLLRRSRRERRRCRRLRRRTLIGDQYHWGYVGPTHEPGWRPDPTSTSWSSHPPAGVMARCRAIVSSSRRPRSGIAMLTTHFGAFTISLILSSPAMLVNPYASSASRPRARHEVLDHGAHGILCRLSKIVGDAGRHVRAPRPRLCPGDEELRGRDAEIADGHGREPRSPCPSRLRCRRPRRRPAPRARRRSTGARRRRRPAGRASSRRSGSARRDSLRTPRAAGPSAAPVDSERHRSSRGTADTAR